MSALQVGDALPEWSVTVRAEPMTAFSLITRDPNPIHWNHEAVRQLGLGEKLVNQGGLNVAYLVNAVAAWPGLTARLRSLSVRFLGNVFDGDVVRATGTVIAVNGDTADLEIRLSRADDVVALSGTAQVRISEAGNQ